MTKVQLLVHSAHTHTHKLTNSQHFHTEVFPRSPHPRVYSINAVGVDIAPFSAMPDEEEVLLLPGLPLTNAAGENPEPDFWTFEVETPCASVCGDGGSLPVTIDYVHPGVTFSFFIVLSLLLMFDVLHLS